jgi:hypothetical protein
MPGKYFENSFKFLVLISPFLTIAILSSSIGPEHATVKNMISSTKTIHGFLT